MQGSVAKQPAAISNKKTISADIFQEPDRYGKRREKAGIA
jgi:hypothetical protein